jgi:hypothetical protein
VGRGTVAVTLAVGSVVATGVVVPQAVKNKNKDTNMYNNFFIYDETS